MGLYQQYRPTKLKDFFGNDSLKRDLKPFLDGTRKPPKSILFTGPSGCGKTTLARILAYTIGCAKGDISELDTADFRGIDSIRDIRRQMNLIPLGGQARVWILDECHKLTNDAQNALLKALENPPAHVYFILCTTDPQLLLKTVLTRCTQFAVEPLSTSELVGVLERVCEGEQKDVGKDTLKMLAKQAQGSPRAAISALERVLGRSPEEYEDEVDSFRAREVQVKDLCQALLKSKSWKEVSALVRDMTEEPESIRRAVLGYMAAVLLNGRDNPRAALVIEAFKDPYYNTGRAGLALSCYQALLQD